MPEAAVQRVQAIEQRQADSGSTLTEAFRAVMSLEKARAAEASRAAYQNSTSAAFTSLVSDGREGGAVARLQASRAASTSRVFTL